MKAKYIIGGVIIIVFTFWGGSAFLNTTIRYVSLAEARGSERMVQVMGSIDFATVNYDAENTRLEFVVFDSEAKNAATAERLAVVYDGLVPGNFDQATSVVLKGTGDGEVFAAEQMLVKCPSKYQGAEGDDLQDLKRHEDAQQEGEG
jgi:cytochrome c-type biogenesis protein CcmE